MKILLLSWRCIKNPHAGGSETYFHELAKYWVKKGHTITWFSPSFKGAPDSESLDGIQFVRKGNRLTVYMHAFLSYSRGRLGSDYDIILDIENGIPFFSPLYSGKTPVILHIHHVHKSVWFKEFRFPLSHVGAFLETKVMPFVYKRIPVVTLSNSSAREIKEEGLTAYDPYIVNPGIHFVTYKKIPKSTTPLVLFLNRVKKYKGVETLLRAARILEKNIPSLEIAIAGGGEDLARAQAYAQSNSLKNVTFLGRVSEEKKYELMRQAWVFVNPSFKEGWGIVNIEANYVGTPVVGSNVAGIQDSIVDGKTGLLFTCDNASELAEKIRVIMENKTLRTSMEKEATLWARKFDWESKADSYLDFLQRYAVHRRA